MSEEPLFDFMAEEKNDPPKSSNREIHERAFDAVLPSGRRFTLLSEARDFIFKNGIEGIECPCCGQNARVYWRFLGGAMCRVLALMYRWDMRSPGEFLKVEDFLKSVRGLPASVRGDFPKLRFWGFIERYEGEREDGSARTGYYRITAIGKDFLAGKTKAPKHFAVYKDTPLYSDEEMVSISDVFKKKFDFGELMSGDPLKAIGLK